MDKTMCISADKRLQEFLESVPEDHSHRRMVQQEVKCGFGLDGVCCRLCSNVGFYPYFGQYLIEMCA